MVESELDRLRLQVADLTADVRRLYGSRLELAAQNLELKKAIVREVIPIGLLDELRSAIEPYREDNRWRRHHGEADSVTGDSFLDRLCSPSSPDQSGAEPDSVDPADG